MDITLIKGIGPKTKEILYRNGIQSINDLIEFFPAYYEFFELGLKQGKCNVIAEIVQAPKISFFKKNLSAMTFKVNVDDQLINVVIYNRNYLSKHLTVGKKIVVQGNYDNRIVATNIYFSYEAIRPHYKIKDIAQNTFRKYIKEALTYKNVRESLSDHEIEKYKLLTKEQLINVVHNPKTTEDVKQIYRRTKYEEFLYYQLELKQIKQLKKIDGIVIPENNRIKEFIQSLSFDLTNDQQNAIKDILRDLSNEESMNRLLQGDVGSGKTIVSTIALYNTYLAGFQSVFMAPTEILAEQHYKKIKQMLPDVEVVLLTSNSKNKEILEFIENNNAIIIGTHALFQKDVIYQSLGLVVTDEQHRFGVDQRKALSGKGFRPNVLSMSATPIPRTLAISLFGDIDISTINEMPMGRKTIDTFVRPFKDLKNITAHLQSEINDGRQVYIVAPMIEESETMNGADIKRTNEFFKQSLDATVEVLHGRMKADKKEEVMRRFVSGEVSCLISTTVIEVGVDVANATVMVILNADRFGLSQLHQLRGRVGRGIHQSYCYLVSDSKNEVTIERLSVLAKTNNGFEISEEDLRLRGPGDFLGSRQSGFPEFTYGDIFKDFKILDVARKDAEEIVYNIMEPRNLVYKKYLDKVLGGSL